jgi:hypothetical protein
MKGDGQKKGVALSPGTCLICSIFVLKRSRETVPLGKYIESVPPARHIGTDQSRTGLDEYRAPRRQYFRP